MVTINIVHLDQGHTLESKSVAPKDLQLDESLGFVNPINIDFEIDKVGNEHYVITKLETVAHVPCDRCAESYDAPISDSVKIILTKDDELLDQDDVYRINEGTTVVDVTESVRETLILALPEKKLCSQECKGLCAQCGANLNQGECSCDKNQIDPRWEGLKKLLDN